MQIESTIIPGCVAITPQKHGDDRGFFMELYHADRYRQCGITEPFVQDNFSRSSQGTLRGLHYQLNSPQGKLVQVVRGEVFDVAVDLRRSSPAFGKGVGILLNDQNRKQLYVPAGCAHGFLVLSESADFLYKCTSLYAPEDERVLLWNDPDLQIPWPQTEHLLLSGKDQQGIRFQVCDTYP